MEKWGKSGENDSFGCGARTYWSYLRPWLFHIHAQSEPPLQHWKKRLKTSVIGEIWGILRTIMGRGGGGGRYLGRFCVFMDTAN